MTANDELLQSLSISNVTLVRDLIEQAVHANYLLLGSELIMVAANKQMRQYLHLSEEDVGKPIRAITAIKADIVTLLQAVYTSGESQLVKISEPHHKPDGTLQTYYFDCCYAPLKNTDGQVYGIVANWSDVTERVTAQLDLIANDVKLRSIINTAPAAIGLFVGRDLIVEMPNQTFIDIVGKGPDIVGKPLREVMPELQNQPFLQILDDVYTSGKMFQSFGAQVDIVQQGVMTHNFYNITYTPILDDTGQVYAILDIAIDVTEAVKARQQLEEAETNLRTALELAELGSWGFDLKHKTLQYSDRIEDWIGIPNEAWRFETGIDPIPESDRPRIEQALRQAMQPDGTGIYDEEHPIINRTTGQVRIIHAKAKAFFDTAQQAVKLVGAAQDITQQRQLQLALEQQVSQRTQQLQTLVQELKRSNESLEQFAYIASHDLQEPLRKIQSFGDLLSEQYKETLGEGQVYLERMQSAANRMSGLIKDLLAFSRISARSEQFIPVDLNEVVQAALADLDLRVQENQAQVHVEALPTVMGNQQQLVQLFQNLLSNALKFRQTGVRPIISINVQPAPVEALAALPILQPAAGYHRIEVSDNGIGFEMQYADRIFQVFQRLHSRNEFAGTGIGLAICAKVASNHGGAITANSQPGKGSIFSVFLPVTDV